MGTQVQKNISGRAAKLQAAEAAANGVIAHKAARGDGGLKSMAPVVKRKTRKTGVQLAGETAAAEAAAAKGRAEYSAAQKKRGTGLRGLVRKFTGI